MRVSVGGASAGRNAIVACADPARVRTRKKSGRIVLSCQARVCRPRQMHGKRDTGNSGRSRTEGQVVAVHKLVVCEELRPGKTVCVNLDGREILLCRTAAGLFAVDNLCTHAAARLCEGRLRGNSIICPLHGAAFDVRDGTALTRPARDRLRVYPLRVDGEDVLLEIAD